jgi:hypothetical protein
VELGARLGKEKQRADHLQAENDAHRVESEVLTLSVKNAEAHYTAALAEAAQSAAMDCHEMLSRAVGEVFDDEGFDVQLSVLGAELEAVEDKEQRLSIGVERLLIRGEMQASEIEKLKAELQSLQDISEVSVRLQSRPPRAPAPAESSE